MGAPQALVEHLFRRAGFGLSVAEAARLADVRSYRDLVDLLLASDPATADVDDLIGVPGHVNVTSSGPFSPNRDINHARQRWLFRMVHATAPLREKMALIWHHHFATAYTKIQGVYEAVDATRLMAAKPTEDLTGHRGQIELFREYALGNFRDLLIEVAKDPAMLVWLDGATNTKAKPQENFGRELMELFTFGVENYVETDVYAAARVFTGWNLQRTASSTSGGTAYRFVFRSAEHETSPKEFSFPIYSSRGRGTTNQIPARSGAGGMQDGIDLVHALAFHPETARRMARRLWTWFVSETRPPDDAFVQSIARVYLDNDTNMRAVMRAVLLSPQFQDPANFHQRYAWPVEFVVRAIREVGFVGFSVNNALTPLLNMGQQLFEPPDVNGWEVGPGWFSTGGMLARMNFASVLAANQSVALRNAARPYGGTPESLVDFASGALTLPALVPEEYNALVSYVRAGNSNWTGSDAQLLVKTPGLCHLLTGSAEFQLI
jgi:uncharacterized protein (DUF1800 family)